MKSILVTGGAGYIGSHTCKLLANSGYTPVCYDNLTTGFKDFVRWGPLEVGDIRDRAQLLKVMKQHQPFAVIHFAASAYVGESVINPLKYYDNNVAGTVSLLSTMKEAAVNKIVFSSTCATYGNPLSIPIDETAIQKPINPYGWSKLFIEKILNDLALRKEISQVSLRYFNAAGADKDGEIGESHDPETHLIPLAIQSGLNNSVLKVFGTDYSTRDGSAVRDYIHVEDLASAHVAALNYLEKNEFVSEFFNLGTSVGVSVLEIIEILKSLDLSPNVDFTDRREGDPPELIANPNKANKLLNWYPVYKNPAEIIKTAVKWHLKTSNHSMNKA